MHHRVGRWHGAAVYDEQFGADSLKLDWKMAGDDNSGEVPTDSRTWATIRGWR